MTTRLFSFSGGDTGRWNVVPMQTVVGETLAAATKLNIVSGSATIGDRQAAWVLRGITSNERYVDREEKNQAVNQLLELGRPRSELRSADPATQKCRMVGTHTRRAPEYLQAAIPP